MGSSKLELRMKSLLILALAGLACSYQPHHQYFATGQEYVYNYSGRILTGIPQIDSTFAGMSMEGEVIVQATSQNSFKMMMRNVKFGTFNDHLSGSSQQPTNWRNVQLESSTPLTSQYQQYMESPVEFTVEQGKFSTVKVNSEEPQWAVNFKKALVASIKVQHPHHGLMALTAASAETTTTTGGPTSSPPRSASSSPQNCSGSPTGPSPASALLCLRRLLRGSGVRRRGATSTRPRGPRSPPSTLPGMETATPSRSTLTSTRRTRFASRRSLWSSALRTPSPRA